MSTRISNKINIPTAITERSIQNIGGCHITTGNFMKPIVARCMELVPGQTVDIQTQIFTRLEPLVVPTFGRAEIRTKFFWVPFRTIMPSWNEFITDTPHVFDDGSVSIVPYVPYIRTNEIYYMFLADDMSTVTDGVGDFIDANGDERAFTELGRFSYNILRSLGYGFILRDDVVNTCSAFPLMSLLKAYIDWLYPSQYANDSTSAWVQSLFTNDIPQEPNVSFFDSSDLERIMKLLRNVCYDVDYFTSAWDNPNAPNDGLFSSVRIEEINRDSSSQASRGGAGVGINDTPPYNNAPLASTSNAESSAMYAFSQYTIDSLKALTDYCKRHQLSGSRAMDRYLSRFGHRLASEKLNRSILIDSFEQQIQFGDVTSTASTETAGLGDYAGKGLSFGDKTLHFSSDNEYGMLLCISVIVPHIDYYQGLQRHTLHMSRLDFYTPEFDALGVQAITKSEVYVPNDDDSQNVSSSDLQKYMDSIFGFTSRYAEYKKGFSQLTGDYSIRSRSVGKDSWYLMRDMSHLFFGDNVHEEMVHSPSFILSLDSEQYNRIFQNTNPEDDKFNIVYDFNIKSSFPGSRLFDTYEFTDDGKSDTVTVNVGGTTVS